MGAFWSYFLDFFGLAGPDNRMAGEPVHARRAEMAVRVTPAAKEKAPSASRRRVVRTVSK